MKVFNSINIFLVDADSSSAQEELRSLIASLQYNIVDSLGFKDRGYSSGSWLTKGRKSLIIEKILQITGNGDTSLEKKLHLIVLGRDLSFSEEAKLEKQINEKLPEDSAIEVINRTGIILEIFSRRARTHEGRLQVKLGKSLYERQRLVKMWSHLERQRGGFGFLAGPGERQLEIDRRNLGTKITKLKLEIKKLSSRRKVERNHRQAALAKGFSYIPQVALVGYTNAGKSSLMNSLIDENASKAFCSEKSFATLDSLHRVINLCDGTKAILTDSVGFVEYLPPLLLEAFSATLEEISNADIIIHVQDSSDSERLQKVMAVDRVLDNLFKDRGEAPQTIVFANKSDLREEGEENFDNVYSKDYITGSALTGVGIQSLKQRLSDLILANYQNFKIDLPYDEDFSLAVSWLYNNGFVISRENRQDAARMMVALSDKAKHRFCGSFQSIRIL